MARPQRPTTTSLIDRIRSEPWRFEFVQVMRLLELARRHPSPASEASMPPSSTRDDLDEKVRALAGFDDVALSSGDGAAPHSVSESTEFGSIEKANEGAPVRLHASPSLNRHPTQVVHAWVDSDKRLHLKLGCFGLFGANGAMPFHYTKWIVERLREHDHAMIDFLDLFNHRLSLLLYDGATRYRFAIDLERKGEAERRSASIMTATLNALLGLGTPQSGMGVRDRLPCGDDALRAYAGLFMLRRLSASVLEQVLSDYFRLRVRIEQNVSHWLRLPQSERSRLGRDRNRPTPVTVPAGDAKSNRPQRGTHRTRTPVRDADHCYLGHDLILGDRARDALSRFRVWIGPVDYHTFCRLLPEGDMHQPLVSLVRHSTGPEFDFDLRPVLKPEEVPANSIGRSVPPQRLGRNFWLGSRHRSTPFAGATLRPQEDFVARRAPRKRVMAGNTDESERHNAHGFARD